MSRLLLSEPFYHSSFVYVKLTTDLNSREINVDQLNNPNALATKSSLLDYFSNRKHIQIVKPYLQTIVNLTDFVKMFYIINNTLKIRNNSHRIVVIFYPRIRYNPNDLEKHKQYCHHQFIRHANWDITNLKDMQNEETAIFRWNEFLKTADAESLRKIQYIITKKTFDCNNMSILF